jgi:D-arabinose 1-dehydrogenase-like Zn-dependent alcohol dehydrogenase
MKALVVESPGVLKVMDLAEPKMGEYEARCEMLYGATCTATDLAIIDNKVGWTKLEYPVIIGHESIGKVVEVGSKVRNFKIGDLIARVYTRETNGINLAWGGMAEWGLAVDWKAMKEDGIPEDKWDYYRVNQVIPGELIDPIDATMIITWRENLSWINRMGVKSDDNVLVVGSGGNGMSIAACATTRGAHVTVIGNESRRKCTMNTGVEAFINYKDRDAIDVLVEKRHRNIDYIIDATGKKETLTPYMSTLREGGTAALYGMNDFATYTIGPVGGPKYFRFFNSYAGIYDEAETHDEVINLIRAEKLDAGNWLDKDNIFTWDNAPNAYDHVRAKKAVKAVIKLSNT